MAVLISAIVLLQGCSSTSIEPKPNFVFILVDDLGYMDIGANNPDSFYETPSIDRLAADGIRLTQAYAAAPVCSPTRASIMTGKYPGRLHTTDYFGAPQPSTVGPNYLKNKVLYPAEYIDQLPASETTMAEAFGEAGYGTFFAGKWHLGNEGSYPEDHGFDVNKGGHERGGPYGGDKYFSPFGNPRLDDGPDGEYLPIRLGAETASFIKESVEGPFLAVLSFYSVHTPLLTTPELRAKYEAKGAPEETWGQEGKRKVRLNQTHPVYAGMVEAMDTAVGMVMTALDEAGVAENTVVIFTSDNGGLSTSEGHPTSNLPLRAGKGWLYEGGIREPTIVKWPGVTRAGTVSDEQVMSTDFLPTMLEIADLPRLMTDGVSITGVLAGASADDRSLFWHYPHYGNQGGSPGGAIRKGDWKLIQFFEAGSVELYNIADDLSESMDVSGVYPQKTAALLAELKAWQKDAGVAFGTRIERADGSN